jgi:hypothetical protein
MQARSAARGSEAISKIRRIKNSGRIPFYHFDAPIANSNDLPTTTREPDYLADRTSCHLT